MFHMFQVIYAHEWMNDAHDHEMQVQLGKTNTRGVTSSSSSHTKPNRWHNELAHACHLKAKRFLVVKPGGESCDTGGRGSTGVDELQRTG